ncbi:MAG: GreA/GreB family elongation factor [Deltaproteobacteria bacterium]|nr:GreA/GreB family elongation factor [Deltaproteobacteria bacterium]
MNKAFIKEDDIDSEVRWEEPLGEEPRLVTPEGFERYRSELEMLERGAGSLDAQGERRLLFLRRLLPLMSVVPPRPGEQRAYFGAWVTVEDEDGQTRVYRLVGRDEVSSSASHVNVDAPVGRALLGKKAADVGVIARPDGEYENLEILEVSWTPPPLSKTNRA